MAERTSEQEREVGPTPKGRSPSKGLRRRDVGRKHPDGCGAREEEGVRNNQCTIRLIERRRFYARAKSGTTPREIADVSRETRRGTTGSTARRSPDVRRRRRACRERSKESERARAFREHTGFPPVPDPRSRPVGQASWPGQGIVHVERWGSSFGARTLTLRSAVGPGLRKEKASRPADRPLPKGRSRKARPHETGMDIKERRFT